MKLPLSAETCGLYPKGSKAASHKQENSFDLSWLNTKNSCEFFVGFFIMYTCECLDIHIRNCLFLYNIHIKLTTKEDELCLSHNIVGLLVHQWDLLQEAHPGWRDTEALLLCATEVDSMISFWGTVHYLSSLGEIQSLVFGPGELANQPKLFLAQ